MKKIVFGCIAIVLAVAVSAFTAPRSGANLVYFFPLDEDGTPKALSSVPQTTNTYECPGELYPCSAGYGAYTDTNGIYTASGSMIGGTEEYQD